MKGLLIILGILGIGEGVAAVMLPQRYVSFWIRAIKNFMDGLKPGLVDHPTITRVLGLTEMGLGLWLLARILEPEVVSVDENVPQSEHE